MIPLILASASPRRQELLRQIGLKFQVVPADVDEQSQGETPVQTVKELARRKAYYVAEQVRNDGCILGADTVVVFEGRIMGKPGDREEAVSMLSSLQGNTHSVFTGVCAVKKQGKEIQEILFAEETKVTIYKMEMWEIETYADTLEPMDKAGAYGIQGIFAKYIQCIQGDYNNVVGLPVSRIYQEILKEEFE
jgi:septum formation protein